MKLALLLRKHHKNTGEFCPQSITYGLDRIKTESMFDSTQDGACLCETKMKLSDAECQKRTPTNLHEKQNSVRFECAEFDFK